MALLNLLEPLGRGHYGALPAAVLSYLHDIGIMQQVVGSFVRMLRDKAGFIVY